MDSKAVWDDETTAIFINACIEQIYNKERRGLTFSKVGWQNIVTTFNAKTGKEYDKKQLKNRLDILRKDFKSWDALTKETGVSRDPVTSKVLASNEWWQRKIQENPSYRKFRHTCLKFEAELHIIFKDVVAAGDDVVAPSFTQPMTQQDDEEHCYRPNMDELEGSGDSEDELFGVNPAPSTGVTDELAGIGLSGLTPPHDPTDSGSHGKRKRVDRSGRRKKQKMPASRQIADAVSVIANASKDRALAISEMSERSVEAAVQQLFQLEEVQHDEEFRVRCMTLLQDKSNRDMFMSTAKHNPEFLVGWLQFKVRDM